MGDRRVALLRGINVGKAKRVAMADLRALLVGLGYGDVRTLLNSGNAVYTSTGAGGDDEAGRIEGAIAEQLGVSSRATVLRGADVARAVRKNPLSSVANNPSRLLVMAFQDAKSMKPLKALLDEDWGSEALALDRRMAFLWCPDGVLKSRVNVAVSRAVGEAGTARNLATMTKILALVESS